VLSPPAFAIASLAGRLIDCFANRFPFFTSRIACFWVGGFEEIEFEFRAVKSVSFSGEKAL
jgi:hypothetical protein